MNVPVIKNFDTAPPAQRGIAAAEFTIVLPLVLFLILGVSEFGRGFMQYNTLTRAVRDAARYAAGQALFGQSQVVVITPELETETANLAAYGNSGGSGAPLLPDLTAADVTLTDAGGGDISVLATYQYQPIIAPFIPAILQNNTRGGAFTIQAEVIMKAL